MSGSDLCLQDNKEPPIQFHLSSQCVPSMHGEEEEGKASACWNASWNASGTLVAVTSSGLIEVTVYNLKARRVVRQALFCCAQRGPPHCVRRQMG